MATESTLLVYQPARRRRAARFAPHPSGLSGGQGLGNVAGARMQAGWPFRKLCPSRRPRPWLPLLLLLLLRVWLATRTSSHPLPQSSRPSRRREGSWCRLPITPFRLGEGTSSPSSFRLGEGTSSPSFGVRPRNTRGTRRRQSGFESRRGCGGSAGGGGSGGGPLGVSSAASVGAVGGAPSGGASAVMGAVAGRHRRLLCARRSRM